MRLSKLLLVSKMNTNTRSYLWKDSMSCTNLSQLLMRASNLRRHDRRLYRLGRRTHRCFHLPRVYRPLPGASCQDELQSFGLETNMMYRGHLPGFQATVQKLQLVGFLQDLQTQSGAFKQTRSHRCGETCECLCRPAEQLLWP